MAGLYYVLHDFLNGRKPWFHEYRLSLAEIFTEKIKKVCTN